MIIANLHHEDVTPLDEATSFQRLLDKGRTVYELAAPTIRSAMRPSSPPILSSASRRSC